MKKWCKEQRWATSKDVRLCVCEMEGGEINNAFSTFRSYSEDKKINNTKCSLFTFILYQINLILYLKEFLS